MASVPTVGMTLLAWAVVALGSHVPSGSLPPHVSKARYNHVSTVGDKQAVTPVLADNENQRVHAEAVPAQRASDSKTVGVTVGVRLPAGRAEEIERLVWAVADPRSPSYGKHLNRDELRALRASDLGEVQDVVLWLR